MSGGTDTGGDLTLRSGSATTTGEILISRGADYDVLGTTSSTLNIGDTNTSGNTTTSVRAG